MNKVGAYLPKDSIKHWAAGCDKCDKGIVSAPPLTGACETYLERLVQALAKELVFCDCQAGKQYYAFLLHRHAFLKREATQHPLMAQYAQRGTHLDIEVAKLAIEHSYLMGNMPTIHAADEAVAESVPA